LEVGVLVADDRHLALQVLTLERGDRAVGGAVVHDHHAVELVIGLDRRAAQIGPKTVRDRLHAAGVPLRPPRPRTRPPRRAADREVEAAVVAASLAGASQRELAERFALSPRPLLELRRSTTLPAVRSSGTSARSGHGSTTAS
jgi:hypothetical protein